MKHVISRMKNATYWNRSTSKRITVREIDELKAQGHEVTVISLTSPTPRVLCEFCGKHTGSPEDTVCMDCDRKYLSQFNDVPASVSTRRCRLCERPLSDSRYFSCDICIPYLDNEDLDMEVAHNPRDFLQLSKGAAFKHKIHRRPA